MRIKVTLLGLFIANSMVYPAYADNELNKDGLALKKAEKEPTKFELSGSLTMTPSLTFEDGSATRENGVKVGLACKADVPKVLCDKNAEIKVAVSLNKKEVKLDGATAILAKMLTVGYTGSIFAHKESNALGVSAKVFQIKLHHTFDCFQLGYAIESPVAVQVGRFDKTSPAQDKEVDPKAKKEDSKEDPNANKDKEDKKPKVNQVEDPKKDKDLAFEIKNSLPALGLSLGLVTDRLNIGLSGLARLTDYAHIDDDASSGQKKTTTARKITWGGNLGIQYKVVPEKFTVTGQATYVAGLGDYVSGLKGIQGEEERKEMCAVYYTDAKKSALTLIDAYGFGGTVEFCVTPDLTFSVAGNYLTTLDDSNKPDSAFKEQWTLSPEVSYKLSKSWTVAAGYDGAKENRISKAESKDMNHKVSGSLKFSF